MNRILVAALLCLSGFAAGQQGPRSAYQPKNLLINSGFHYYQRGATNGTTGYGLDRWFATAGTVTQITTNLPTKASYGLSMALSAASGYVCQRIEQQNAKMYQGANVTLSGYVRASTGTGALQVKVDRPNTIDSYGGIGKAGTTVTSELAATTVVAATSTTLQKFSQVIPVSANMGAYGFQVCLGNGSSTTTTYELSQVILNEGSQAAPFSLAGGDISRERDLVSKYYWKSWDGNGASPSTGNISAFTPDVNTIKVFVTLPNMRARPSTVMFTNAGADRGARITLTNSFNQASSANEAFTYSANAGLLHGTTGGGLTGSTWYDCDVYADAEL